METSAGTRRPSWVSTRWGVAVTATVAAVMLAVGLATWVGPQPMHLGFQTMGDESLAQSVRKALGHDGSDASTAGYRGIAVAELDDGDMRWAGLGNRGDGFAPTDTTPFEIGSITKLFTGLMLADAVDRGEVRLGAELSTYLPQLAGTPTGTVTLEELATHRSGLPAYADDVTGATYEGQGDSDVASLSADDVIAQSATLTLSGRGTYQYSNLGVSLLGYALTKASGAPSWVAMVTERVLRPAHMGHTTFAASESQVPSNAAEGRQMSGRQVPYSVGSSYFPAGTATFSTLDDLTSFARWVIEGKAIGLWALEPRYDASSVDKIGLLWMATRSPAGMIEWHNGSVPGFSAILRLDIAHKRAVAVLGNTNASVDGVGIALLGASSRMYNPEPGTARGLVLLVGLALVGCMYLASRSGRKVVYVAVAVAAQAGLVIAVRYTPWQLLPGWIWAVGAGLVAWASVLGVERGRRSLGRALVGITLGIVVAVVQYAMTVWLAGGP